MYCRSLNGLDDDHHCSGRGNNEEHYYYESKNCQMLPTGMSQIAFFMQCIVLLIVQYIMCCMLYVVIEDRCDLKSGVGAAGWVTNRLGWL